MRNISFPIDIQMDGKLYTVEGIIHPKQTGEPLAIAYSRSFLGKRKVQSPSIRIRLAKRVLVEFASQMPSDESDPLFL